MQVRFISSREAQHYHLLVLPSEEVVLGGRKQRSFLHTIHHLLSPEHSMASGYFLGLERDDS